MKACPSCRREERDDALFCGVCRSPLDGTGKNSPTPNGRWYHSFGALVFGFCLSGPLVLPLVWSNPRLSKNVKLVITIIILGLTWCLVATIATMTNAMMKQVDSLLSL